LHTISEKQTFIIYDIPPTSFGL